MVISHLRLLALVVSIQCSRSFSTWGIYRSSRPDFHLQSSNVDDWRDFRAKLVMNESGRRDESWAYDAGSLVEKGSLVVGRVESSLGCHDLRQPYFHKSVILILEHDDDFTKGVILNRPSNLVLDDEDIVYLDDDGDAHTNDESNNSWPVWFGGDIAGLYDENPTIIVLHSITSETGKQVSDEVLPGVLVSSHLGACGMIEAGEATPDSFYTFSGFCGWEPGQLQKEVERGSWYMVASDSKTIWGQLETTKRESSPPPLAGKKAWETFIEKIGYADKMAGGTSDSFSDLMLKEWSTANLCIAKEENSDTSWGDDDIFRAINAAKGSPVGVGTIVRGSSLDEPPFLLHEQFLHKSVILIYEDTDEWSSGLVLNHPTPDTLTLETPGGKTFEFFIRYGGPSGVEDEEEQLVWLHASMGMKDLRIGKPISTDCFIWTCTIEQVEQALDLGYAFPEEFMLIHGYSAWGKEAGSGGIAGQMMEGNLEMVSQDEIDKAWSLLLSQKMLSEETIGDNIRIAHDAWTGIANKNNMRGASSDTLDSEVNGDRKQRLIVGSDVPVSKLADDASRVWVEIFLLGDEEYSPY